jgi:hypothetical protein
VRVLRWAYRCDEDGDRNTRVFVEGATIPGPEYYKITVRYGTYR